jgi:hypothetical protein
MKNLFETPASPILLRRRQLLMATSAAPLAGLTLPAWAQTTTASSIHELRGGVRVNGEQVNRSTVIKPGDTVVTSATGFVVFNVGNDAFMVRERSEMRMEPMAGAESLVGVLRLVTGAIGAAFQKNRGRRTILTPTATAGIRGTAIYTETRGDGSYFCTCHGAVDLQSNLEPRDRISIESSRHNPYWVGFAPKDGSRLAPAAFETHTDDEMDRLEKCVGRRAPWVR